MELQGKIGQIQKRCEAELELWRSAPLNGEAPKGWLPFDASEIVALTYWIKNARLCLISCRGVMDCEGFEEDVQTIDKLLAELDEPHGGL